MNLTLSVPDHIAAKAREVSARQGKSLSAWFRDQVNREAAEEVLKEIAAYDPATAEAVGSALPLEEYWDDARWRGLAEKHLR